MNFQIKPVPEELPFDFESGDLALDFANTAEWHASDQPEEHLLSYADLVVWGAAAGLLTPAEAEALSLEAARRPGEADQWHARAIELREALYRIFSAVAAQDSVNPADLETLTDFWREAARHTHLTLSPEGLGYRLEKQSADPLSMLWPVVHSAVNLLSSSRIERVGQCQDDRGCGWLFIDTSRNRTRRWCSMESCGNRAKAQRHYNRLRASRN